MNRYQGFVGKVLDGRYKILELVGMGGMACVLKAQDLVMNRIVAIKILNDEYNGNEAAETRFIDESKAVAMLSHKNIVSVYDVAIYPDIKYIVMEYLDGITLREYLDNKGVLPWKEACIYVLQILRALEHAHSKGVVHRDIKPQNVILHKSGDIKVTDFGIAKLPNSETKDEKAIGTVYYISPEQACGKETDYYSDIYSVGIMLYEAVTGTLPFLAEKPIDVAIMQVNNEPVNPRDHVITIPIGVSQIILKAMEKSPDDRFASAHAMAKAIEWVLRNPDVIFSISASGVSESTVAGSTSVVSIDMIDTAEIQPYGEDEIADSLGKKNDKPKAVRQPKAKGKAEAKKTTRKRSKSMFPIIVGVTIAFLVISVILAAMVGINWVNDYIGRSKPEEVTLPNITGKIYTAEFESQLENGKSFGVNIKAHEIIEVKDDNLENNYIVSTDPPAGSSVRPEKDGNAYYAYFDSITINRSEKVVIPDIIGLPKANARVLLEDLGLNVSLKIADISSGLYWHDDQVVQTIPEENKECRVGDTIDVYYFSRGGYVATEKMPDCYGMTKEEATLYASTYGGYSVIFVEEALIGGNNTIVAQSIEPGAVNPAGTEVTLTIATPLIDVTGLTYNELLATPGVEINDILSFTAPADTYDSITSFCGISDDFFACANHISIVGGQNCFDDGTGIVVYWEIRSFDETGAIYDIITVNFNDDNNSGDNGIIGDDISDNVSDGGTDISTEIW